MEEITVLSPHRDDAGFSLGLTLGFWSGASVKLQVLNFFTQSAYAPHSSAKTTEEISAVREEEDRKALAFIHSDIVVISLHLLDAPLRLQLPFSQITREESAVNITQEELFQLTQHIQQRCDGNLVVAPLGLGNHVDHIAVHRAAVNGVPPQDLAFYEDLPYATWTPPADLQNRVTSTASTSGAALEPFVLQARDAIRRKREIASFYQSQITAEEARNIAQYAQTHGNGERLWLPAHSERWKIILSLATESP